MSEQPIDLKSSVRAIWWRRRLVGAIAGIGLCAGIAYGVLRPPMPSAEALVLLPPTSLTSSGTPARDVNTEIVVATSSPVLTAAGKSVSPPVGATELKHQVGVTALSPDVVQFKVASSHPADAERLANAVASAFVQFVTTSSTTSVRAALAGLQHESSQLTQQIQGLQSQINTVSARLTAEGASSPAGQQDSSLLASLGNEQQQVSVQLDSVNNEIVSNQLTGATAEQGTRVLQRATTPVPTSKLMVLVDGVLGMLVGLLVGIPLALVRARRDRRLHLRDEIARAMGVTVLGSIEARRHRTTSDWTGLLENYRPSPVDVWNLRRSLHRLVPDPAVMESEVRVVSFAGDNPALAAGPQLAIFAETLGFEVTLRPYDDETFAPLRAACLARQIPDHPDHFLSSSAPHLDTEHSGEQLTVSMVAVDAAHPRLDASACPTILAVSSGFGSADDLARLALAAVDSGRTFDGILVVNPDPSDSTTGSVANGDRLGRPVGRHLAPAVSTRIDGGSPIATNGNGTGPKQLEPESDSGAFISLRDLMTVARHRWRPLCAVAVLGLVAGASLHLVVPRKYAATTSLYLSEPAAQDPTQAMANDVSLLQTRSVAARALQALHLRVTPESFLASYQGLSLSNAIVSITTSAHSPTDAVARANAVARAFLGVRTDLLRLQTGVVVDGLQQQVQTLDSQINTLTSSINALSTAPTGTSSGSELANLVDQRSEDTAQVSSLETQIQQEQLNETSVTRASLVLDHGAVVKVSALKVTLVDALSGLVGGLGLALVVLIIAVLVSDRVRSRAQVASALGAPVELSLRHVAPRREMRKRRRRHLLEHPSAGLTMMERRFRAHLESAGGSALAVVEVETAESCALAIAHLGSSLASEGRRVVLVDLAAGRPLASLVGVTSRERILHTVTLGDQSVFLIVGPDDPAEMQDGTPTGADAVLVVASVDPALGAQHLGAWALKAVVVVNARRTTVPRVAAAGAMLRQAGIAVKGAVLLGVDPQDDDTLGVVGGDHFDDDGHHSPGVLEAARW